MDLFDLLQERDLREIRQRLDRLQQEMDPRLVRDLAEATWELRLRLKALVQLLIAKGLIAAEEYADQIVQVRADNDTPA
jgi:hypothetical protein